MADTLDPAQQRVERVLEESLERIQTPRAAKAVVARVEKMCSETSEADRGQAAAQVAQREEEAAAAVEGAASRPSTTGRVAETLETAAAQAVAPTPAAPKVLEAAQAALTPGAPVSEPARRGRELLKDAALQRMPPWEALDARIYLTINRVPHPAWLDSIVWALTIVTMGGWIWVVGALFAYLVRVPRSWQAVMRLLPCVVGATWAIEYPIKAYFRRRRPFVQIVRALVIGKKPGSWSFPSGHTGSSFASAWVLSTIWPRRAPAFFGLASLVGLSRIYAGAHYPGDVLSGASAGVLFAELIRRAVKRLT